MKCGREPGGEKAEELGVCPAVEDTSFDAINRGKNAGRFCWAVAGTFCGGKAQGSFAEKRESCLSCSFFNKVRAEEGTANLRTKFLRFVFTDTGRPLFRDMAYQHVKSGERFITQGDMGDAAYIIQRGSCIVLVEKDGELYPVGHRGEGDIVGMTTILTGEPRNAHVEAETDMELWVLKQEQFADASRDDPDILYFFSELVADRFDSKRPIADRTIGKYVATDIIGRGGFSLVYKGVHPGLNMPVAIKMMRHDMAMDPDFLIHFQNEAKTIAGLNHENIINVYDIEERFKTVFIIMEYLEGESLKHMLERLKRIPPSLALDFLIQICSGLQYAHQHGIIHRDINSSNIIIQRNDRLKILDFGLACPIGTEDFCSLGTMAYMAPEQIEAEAMDQRSLELWHMKCWLGAGLFRRMTFKPF
jgi:predicted Ser/Thr protein kinase